jgi:hypothetical protein
MLAADKPLTPKIVSLANLRVRVAAYGTDFDRQDVVRRIAAECIYVDDRGGVGVRLEPAAAIVRQDGEQFRS